MYEMKDNSLYYGDCLDFVQDWPGESMDLIYLDPPFNSNENYNIIIRKGNGIPAQMRAFDDTWKWDESAAERVRKITDSVAHPLYSVINGLQTILGNSPRLAYLSYMGVRLVELHRLLKQTGSLYLHCDPTASHYLKVILDTIFGEDNFKNEVLWCYRNMPTKAKKWQANSDTMLFYTKSNRHNFNVLRGKYTAGSLKTFETARRVGYNANHARMMVTIFDEAKYKKAVAEGKIPAGMRETHFEEEGPPLNNWWDDIKILGGPKNKERVGFTTQKPLALLHRIVAASSNEGDVVLDPFCGSGTTVVAAQELERRWIGIDISAITIGIAQHRLERIGVKTPTPTGMPQDLVSARRLSVEKPFVFEAWAITQIAGLFPNEVQTGDTGIDGRGLLLSKADDHPSRMVVAQVKGSSTFNLSHFRDFLHVIQRENAACGVYITLTKNSTAMARSEASKLGIITFGASQYPRIQIWSIEELFCKNRKWPKLPALTDPHTGDAIKPTLM